ncbi:ABC transporter substrate-binding protein [Phytoactinopolyspora endophytica]|uniref:ABC transporter substrate-binding protein n=1 Tax=Phytoactinopolyspora endophytica TaxID=1642495 RepID=UPI00101D6B0D|nr:ABC transporter substrate-binding protein [Phytoactinopolyspora endophytica]
MRTQTITAVQWPPRGLRTPAVAAFLLSAALVLQGCTSSDDNSDGQDDSNGQVELVFFNQSRGQEETLTELAADYEDQTGVGVTIETPGPGNYLQDLQSRAQAERMPDLYSATDPFEMAPYYNAGWAMELSSELDGEWGETFSPAAVDLWRFADGNNLDVPEGIYSVHWETALYAMLVAESTGISPDAPPETMSELTTELSEEDAQFSVAASLAHRLLLSYASNFMTDEELEATLAGRASWETDAWRETFQLLIDLRDAGVVASDEIPGGTEDNPGVEQSFFSVRDVEAIFDGTFGIGVQRATAPEFTEYFSMGVPAADNGAHEPRAVARRGRGAVVNPEGEHPDEALAFARWLTEPEQQQVFADEVGMIPTSAELLDSGSIPPEMQGFAALAEDAQVLPGAFMAADVEDAISRASQSIVLGEMSVEEALAQVQAAQDQSS